MNPLKLRILFILLICAQVLATAQQVAITSPEGQVNISGKPENSKVYINNEVIGYTPITLKTLLVDSYELKIQRKGYIPFEKRITIQENKTTYINYELKKVSSKLNYALRWTSFGISTSFIAYGAYRLIESQNAYNNYYNATAEAASLREKDIALRKAATISFTIGGTMVLPIWLLTKNIKKDKRKYLYQ